MRTVAVFFGGNSCENEISVLTGVFVLHLLDREKYIPFPVYIHTDGGMYTSPKMTELETFRALNVETFRRVFFDGGELYAWNASRRKVKRLCKPDVALNCCHGGLGEGGGVSALTAWNDIPFASPDLTSSGVFMDKATTKLVASALNVPTLDYIRVNEADYRKRGAFLLRSVESRLKYPVVIKPSHLGSSIGITLARDEKEAKEGIEKAFALDNRLIIEKYLPNKTDVNCAACLLGGEICVSEAETAFGDGIYSFEEKYVKRQSDTPLNSEKAGGRVALSGEIRAAIRSYTRTLYKRMNMQGAVRMDFLVAEGKAYLCEVNTVPGSLAYYLFCERLTDAKRFLSDILDEAVETHAKQKKTIVKADILRMARVPRKK